MRCSEKLRRQEEKERLEREAKRRRLEHVDLREGAAEQLTYGDGEADDFPTVSNSVDSEMNLNGTQSQNTPETPQSESAGAADIDVEAYPELTGSSLGNGVPRFAKLQEDLQAKINPALEPLKNPETWEMAHWLLTSGASGTAQNRLFGLRAVSVEVRTDRDETY